MKKAKNIIAIIAVILAFSPPIFSQNSIQLIEFWTDGNSESRTRQTISAASVFSWQDEINLATLVDGLHTFNARFKDEYGVWSPVETRFFVKQTNALGQGELKKITALEYWMNGNSSNRTQRILNAQTTFAWEELIDVANISDGVNTFNARFKDEYGVWSPVETRFFVKQTNALGQGKLKKITALEYWMNGNSSNRTQRILNAQTTFAWEELIDVANIPDGVNTFNARFKDEYGVWSPVETRFFVKQSTALTEGNKNITNLEYWMDGNTANRVSKTITPNNPYHWEELIPTDELQNGLHTFNVRWKDEKGIWTMVHTLFFVKDENQFTSLGENKIVGYRLWFSEEPDYFENIPVVSTEKLVEINDSVPLTYLPKGRHQIAYQLKDARGVWSPVIADSIDKPDHALFSFVADKLEITQGETVKFTPSTKLFIDSIIWNFGDGMTEINFEPEHKYDSTGEFDVMATVWHKGTNEGVPYTEIKYITVTPTGLLSPQVYTLKMYPVPAKNSLTIESPSLPMNSIQLLTLNGKVIKDVLPENPEKTVLSIGNLQPGTYIVVVKTDKGWLTNKIVKE
jgi:PKD repeat protein